MKKPIITHYPDVVGKSVAKIETHPNNISRNALRRPIVTLFFDDGSYLPIVHNDKNTQDPAIVRKSLAKFEERARNTMLFLPITDAYVSTIYHDDDSIESIITITVNNDSLNSCMIHDPLEYCSDAHKVNGRYKDYGGRPDGFYHKALGYQRRKEHSLSLFSKVQRHPIFRHKTTNMINTLSVKNNKKALTMRP